MLDSLNGLPLHPLVVHGVVVLLPLAVVGTIAIALRPAWRTRYGLLVVASALAATVLVPVATSSGESLEERVGDPGEHAGLGDQLLWFSLALLVTSALLVYLQWRSEKAPRTGDPAPDASEAASARSRAGTWLMVSAGVAVVAALACGVQVYRVGDSGARAAWGDTPASSSGR